MDIPFIRFALPLLILYLFWNTFIVNPWVGEPIEDLVANPMEWIAAADEYAGEATKVAKGKVEPVTDPNEAIEPLHSFEPAASDLPLLSPSSEIPASTELIAAQPALEVEQPAAPVAARPYSA